MRAARHVLLDETPETDVVALVALGRVADVLTPREWRILAFRFAQELTLEECGRALHLSRRRVGSIEGRALNRLYHAFVARERGNQRLVDELKSDALSREVREVFSSAKRASGSGDVARRAVKKLLRARIMKVQA